MKRAILIFLLTLPLTVGALPTIFEEATKLSFSAPTENTDGSPLTDLTGFKVYWSNVSGDYSDANSQLYNDSALTEILLQDISLPDGALFLVMTAVNSQGFESDFSSEGIVKKLGVKYYKDQSAGTVPAAPFSLIIE